MAFGGQTVLDNISWSIRDDRRIGLVGPNGAGKTTLLRVITGQIAPDAGTVQMGGASVGYLKQEVQETAIDRTVVDEAMDAFAYVHQLHEEEEQILGALEKETDHMSTGYSRLLERLDHVHQQLHAGEAHLARPRAETVLAGLGFHADDMDRPMSTFSGGWRMRVALTKLLLRQPDVLLLDEPTNHLDIDSIDWLETYLQKYPGTVVMVSHDRYFLDRMVNGVAELSRGGLTDYAGNYSFYLQERTLRREMQASSYLNQQKMIADTERFVERFRAKSTKARQVQSRVKMLEKLERILPPDSDEASITFRFPEPARSGRTVMELSRFSKRYETREGIVDVFRDAEPLSIERGDKVALIGRNGAGKSTLSRMLAGTEPFKGDRRLGKDVDITFFAQHTADSLAVDHTVLEAVQQVAIGQTETQVRSILGAFLFTGDDVFKPIGVLSGGERSRVALACTLVVPANFLILDEPTNHLDIASISVLIEAMRQYTGTFAVVSHDRHFLDQVATKVWRVEDGAVHSYPGTYSEYLWRVRKESQDAEQPKPTMSRGIVMRSSTPAAPSKASPAPSAKPEAATDTLEDNPYQSFNTFKLRKAYRAAEAIILESESRKDELETLLADPDLYSDATRTRKTREEYDALLERLKEAYAKWEPISDALADRAEEK